MEEKVNLKRREVEFNVGDKVLVKLQPYRQLTLARHLSHKLTKRYYGPYEILERIGKVAYRLALPVTSNIHPVFHVFCGGAIPRCLWVSVCFTGWKPRKTGVVLIGKEVAKDSEIPKAMIPLLEKFLDVFPDEL
ncbi:hypothetical protein Tco_1309532, partial [Tanacetum coccineum]